jgi:hypothetical protein
VAVARNHRLRRSVDGGAARRGLRSPARTRAPRPSARPLRVDRHAGVAAPGGRVEAAVGPIDESAIAGALCNKREAPVRYPLASMKRASHEAQILGALSQGDIFIAPLPMAA